MARIDIQTLILAFEKRIEALEKNPPDKVPTSVIMNLLEKSIDDILKEHFLLLIRNELEVQIKDKFLEMNDAFIDKIITNILLGEEFREELENKIKCKILYGIKQI